MKGPELINMYVGQSEENVREGEWVRRGPASSPSQTPMALVLPTTIPGGSWSFLSLMVFSTKDLPRIPE